MQARRKAKEVQKARLMAVAQRAKTVEAELVAYFEARGHADTAREAAQQRADKAIERGEAAAETAERQAAAAIGRLAALGETRHDIATATGLTLSAVKTALAATQDIPGTGAAPAVRDVTPAA